jgi:RNA polymerase sigma-70 factor (ECF subfamily)
MVDDAQLDAALAAGRDAWPAVAALDRTTFATFLGDRDIDLATAPVADLYLACACAARDAAALQVFEDRYMREVEIAAAKLRAPAGVLDEARQVVRDLLFVGKTGSPAIRSYAGRGDLRGWVRVIAMREVMRLCDRDSREVAVGDDALLDALSPETDPELEQLKALYRDEVKAAFHAAIASLEPRERTLLRHQVIDGLGVEAIGKLYNVHASTAARWLVRARETLLDQTRAALAAKLRLSGPDIDSVLRLVRSRIEVSIERVLKS